MPNLFNLSSDELDELINESTKQVRDILFGLKNEPQADTEGVDEEGDVGSTFINPLGDADRLLKEIEALAKDDAVANHSEIQHLLQVVDRYIQIQLAR